MTARDSILDKCRAFRVRPVRGGVKLSGAEALWLEGLLARLDRLPPPRLEKPLTADERLRLRHQVNVLARERAQRTDRAERSLAALLERAAA